MLCQGLFSSHSCLGSCASRTLQDAHFTVKRPAPPTHVPKLLSEAGSLAATHAVPRHAVDAAPSRQKQQPLLQAPRPRQQQNGVLRLNKLMAERGLCSRREADDWIAQGLVLVDGQVASMGQQVSSQARIEVSPQAHAQQDQLVTLIYHKPIGIVSGQAEGGYTPAVALINEQTHWQRDLSQRQFSPSQLQGIAPAGRLDIDSTGLLVLTQDGRVARQLIGATGHDGVQKDYLVRVAWGDVTQNVRSAFPEHLLSKLRHGLVLDGKPLRPAQVEWQNAEQLRFKLKEGRKRQIRRMCEQVGLRVVGLKRIAVGQVQLGQLPVGTWRYLGKHEHF